MMVRKFTSALIGAGMLLPGFAGALGLGGIELNSALNQPMDAEIKLSKVGDLQEDEIRIRLAGYDEFERAGVERVFFLTGLKFDVDIKPDGSGVIHVTSKKPVKEPFLNFIIEMQWPQGRLLREYTVLMDPPIFNQQAAGIIASPPVSTVVATEEVVAPKAESSLASSPVEQEANLEEVFSETQAEDVDTHSDLDDLAYESVDEANLSDTAEQDFKESPEAAEPELTENEQTDLTEEYDEAEEEQFEATASVPQKTQLSPSNPPTGTYGRVSRYDNLWQISKKVKPANVTVQQTMLAIKKLNSEAFINDNINNLKEGSILRLPALSEIEEIDARLAVSMVAEQNRQWFEEKGGDLSAIPLDTGAYDQLQTVAESDGDARLKLVAANADANADAEGGSLGAREGEAGSSLARMEEALLVAQEDLDRSRLENQELSSRLSDVEEQIKTSNEILQLKDNQIAALQAKLRELEGAGADITVDDSIAANASDAAGVDTDIEVSPTQGTDEGAAPKELAKGAAPEEPAEGAAPEESATGAASEEPADANVEFVEAILAKGKGLIENLKNLVANPMYLLAGGGGLVLLASGLFLYLRKSKTDEEDFDAEGFDDELGRAFDEDEDAAGLDDLEAFDNEGGAQESFNQSDEFLADRTMEAEETVEEFQGTAADAIGEADIYIAYGRYNHAMDLLKQALAKEPGKPELMKKLLEVYGEMGDTAAYTALEAKMGGLDKADEVMSLEKEPVQAFAEATDDSNEFDFSMDFDGEDESSVEDMQSNIDAVENELDASLDFDSNEGGDDADASEFLMTEENGLDLDDDAFAEDLSGELEGLGLEDNVTSADDTAQELEFSLDDKQSDDDLSLSFNLDESSELEDITFDSKAMEASLDSSDDALDMELDSVVEEAEETDAIPDNVSSISRNSESGENIDLADDISNQSAEIEMSSEEGLATADDDDDFDFLNDTDEAATKLDLARAYIDMGDKDGARDILQEVLSEGDEAQKKDANELLQRIA